MKTKIIGSTRIALGWIFIWAFLDKTFGLGFATESSKAWILGGSPTYGFLHFATKGPFVDFYKSLAGVPVVDFLFMGGLLFIGVALLLGIMMRLAAFFGVIMMLLMYTAGFMPPENNPIIDDHIMYALLFIILAMYDAGTYIGFGKKWSESALVKKVPLLK